MTTRSLPKNTRSLLKHIGCALVFFAMSANVQGATTDLATSPLTVSSTVLPNLMFILDDSGSMAWTYLPDVANNFDGKYGYASSQCNGVYYNPDITYTPPVTSAGVSYANSTFTGAWTDGYNTGAGTTNLSTSFRPTATYGSEAAYYYKYTGTKTAAADKNYYNTGSTFYTECNTTPSSGSGATATITVSGSSSSQIDSITVNGAEILSGVTSSDNSSSNVAGYIRDKINACTSSTSGNCTVSGYSATRSSNVVTITAPASLGQITYTPVIHISNAGMTYTPTAFSGGSPAPVFTKVVVSSTSGDTAAGMPADERQNFANWYSYYRTRMNMMKTASGLAFKPIDSNYRVAFMTINNNVNPDVLDFAPFDATQKSNWYTKLYGASPNNSTPLREALSRVGLMYAHKLTSLYGVAIADPMQYSCQKNFTILSTDGFWNGNAGFKLDGTTAVGNQDGLEPRPYNDGSATTITKTTTQLQMSQTQITMTTSQYQARTSTLQTKTGTLQKRTYSGGIWSSWASPAAGSATSTLTVSGNTSASASVDKIYVYTGGTNIIPGKVYGGSTASQLATDIAAAINQCTNAKTGGCTSMGYNGTGTGFSATSSGNVVTITALTSGTFTLDPQWTAVTVTFTPFQNSAGTCTWSSTSQCQYNWGSWSNSASCNVSYSTVTTDGTTWSGNGTDCQYTAWSALAGVASCTAVPQNYSTPTATECTQNTATSDVASCTAASASSGNSYTATTCGTRTVTAGQGVSSCTAVAASTSTGGLATLCNNVTTTTTVTSCTPQTASSSNSYKTITCSAPTTSAGTSDTLADVAEYFYVTDLRTTALGNCTGSTGNTLCATPDSAGVDTYNNVLPSGEDKATWQHMTTYTLGLGTRGSMAYTSPSYLSDSSGDFYSVLTGATADSTAVPPVCSWQANGTICNWPVPVSNTQTAVDDLWHAAVNGRGTYYSATDPAELSTGLSDALGQIGVNSNSMAAATVSNPSMSTNDNFMFASSYTTVGWDGNIVREQMNVDTGAIVVDSSGNTVLDWSARDKLDLKASRTIYTYDSTNANGNKLKSFLYANLTATEQAYFNAPNISTSPPSGTTGLTQYLCASSATCLTATNKTNAAGTALVNFLRGDRTNEGALIDNSKYYRLRSHVLGDIVDSEAAYVKAPPFGYPDAGYGAFKANHAARQNMIYVGANDGMLHAFYAYGGDGGDGHDPVQYMDTATGNVVASSGAGIVQVTGGDEAWAYIPTMVMPRLYTLADKNYANKHQYFVDGTPVTGDICPTVPSTACTSSDWKTIMVGGLNGGGKGYYALDITNPAAPKALWEFTTASDANVGYSYGKPEIIKLNDANGTWVVLVTTGYNNADGVGRLYVLNANTGAIIRTISTGVGSAGTPSGLAHISTMVAGNSFKDNKVTQVYGGDLLGNLWRFDVNGNVGAAGYDAQLLATLKTAGSVIQPITSRPDIGSVDGNVVIYVGTGRYLGTSDLADTTQQSMYAIKDPLSTSTTPSTAVYSNVRAASFVQQPLTSTTCPAGAPTYICTSGQSVLTGSSNVVNFASNSGWYIDFPGSGERATTDPIVSFGTLAFTTNVPQVSSCSSGGYSNAYFLDYKSGAPIATSDSAGNTVVARKMGNAMATRAVMIQRPDGTVQQEVVLSNGTIVNDKLVHKSGSSLSAKRTSWRELINDQ